MLDRSLIVQVVASPNSSLAPDGDFIATITAAQYAPTGQLDITISDLERYVPEYNEDPDDEDDYDDEDW